MARIDDLKAELTTIREHISEAEGAASLSVDGRSLTRQNLQALRDREASLTWAIQSYYRRNSLGRIEFDELPHTIYP